MTWQIWRKEEGKPKELLKSIDVDNEADFLKEVGLVAYEFLKKSKPGSMVYVTGKNALDVRWQGHKPSRTLRTI